MKIIDLLKPHHGISLKHCEEGSLQAFRNLIFVLFFGRVRGSIHFSSCQFFFSNAQYRHN